MLTMDRFLKVSLVSCTSLLIVTAAAIAAARDDRAAPKGISSPELRNLPSAADVNRAKRNAQNLASVFSAGRATAAPALKQVDSVEDAISLLRKGFLGGGPFDTTIFQIPNLPDDQARLAATQLRWKNGQLHYEPTKLRTAPGRLEFGTARKPIAKQATRTSLRHAQNITSVCSSAVAAGTNDLDGVEKLEQAVRLLTDQGIKGGAETGFKDIIFHVPGLTEADIADVSKLLQWDRDARSIKLNANAQAMLREKNPVRVLQDRNRIENLAIARAEAINIAVVNFLQAEGRAAAMEKWQAAGNPDARYLMLAPYLAFAPAKLADYMPEGYSVKLLDSLEKISKAPLLAQGRALEY